MQLSVHALVEVNGKQELQWLGRAGGSDVWDSERSHRCPQCTALSSRLVEAVPQAEATVSRSKL
jgi:hypothetical protein